MCKILFYDLFYGLSLPEIVCIFYWCLKWHVLGVTTLYLYLGQNKFVRFINFFIGLIVT
jgi:hypothetical protein